MAILSDELVDNLRNIIQTEFSTVINPGAVEGMLFLINNNYDSLASGVYFEFIVPPNTDKSQTGNYRIYIVGDVLVWEDYDEDRIPQWEFVDQAGGLAAIELRVEDLENTEYLYEIYENIVSGTTGTVTIPTNTEIQLNRYRDAGDCIITRVDGNSRPYDRAAREADGTVITSTLDTGGNYVLSNPSDSYPVSIVYTVKSAAIDIPNIPLTSIVNIYSVGDANQVTVNIGSFANNLTSDDYNVQLALNTIDTFPNGVFTEGDITHTDPTPSEFVIRNTDLNQDISFYVNNATVDTQAILIDSTALVTFNDSVIVTEDFTVNGTTTTINTSILNVEDKNIVLGNVGSPTDTTADGGGITLRSDETINKTIIWDNANDNWTFNQSVNVSSGLTYKINNVQLASTDLGDTANIAYIDAANSFTLTNTFPNIDIGEDGYVGIGAALERIEFDGTGGVINILGSKVGINEAAPDVDPGGLTINHINAGTTYGFTIKNSNVNHGLTDQLETDTYFGIRKLLTNGGALLRAISPLNAGMYIDGISITPDSSSDSTAKGNVHIRAFTDSVADITAIADADNAFTVANASTTKFLIKGNGDQWIDGKVGIGVFPPEDIIHAVSEAFTSIKLDSYDTSGSPFFVGRRARGSAAIPQIVQNGDECATFEGRGWDGVDTFDLLGRVEFSVDGAPGVDDMPGRFTVTVTPDASDTPVERFRIANTGYTSIAGPIIPQSKLSIYSNEADGAATSAAGIGFQFNDDWTKANIYADGVTNFGGNLHLATHPANSTENHTTVNWLSVFNDGKISTGGETAPDVDPGGLTINHISTSTTYGFTIKNNNINHGITDQLETDTYFGIRKLFSDGGVLIRSISQINSAHYIDGIVATPNTSTNSTSTGVTHIRSWTSSGTNLTSLADADNAFTVADGGDTHFIIKGNGDIWTDGNVGINDAIPGYPLDVTGDINTTTVYRIGDVDINSAGTLTNVAYKNQANVFGAFDQTFDTDTLFIDASANRVGVGTIIPFSILEIKGPKNDVAFGINVDLGSYDYDDVLGKISFINHDSSGSINEEEKAFIRMRVNNTITSGTTDEWRLELGVANRALTGIEPLPHMIVTQDGNVAVGLADIGYRVVDPYLRFSVTDGNSEFYDNGILGPELHTDANASSDPNGNEADATTGWTGAGSTVTSVADPQTGSWAIKITSNDGSNDRADYNFTSIPGARYKISFWAKRGAQGTSQGISSWGFVQFPITAQRVLTTSYVYYEIEAIASGTTLSTRFYSSLDSFGTGAVGDELLIDNMSIKQVIGGDVIARGNLLASNVTTLSTATTPITPAQITADQHNYAGAVGYSWARLNTDASWNITGLTDGFDGKDLLITNVGANSIVFPNESGSSTAANRIITVSGSNVTITANESLRLKYDAVTSGGRWREIA